MFSPDIPPRGRKPGIPSENAWSKLRRSGLTANRQGTPYGGLTLDVCTADGTYVEVQTNPLSQVVVAQRERLYAGSTHASLKTT